MKNIEAIVFDLDGVVIPDMKWHHTFLCQSIAARSGKPLIVINNELSKAQYQNITSNDKLNILINKGWIREDDKNLIYQDKEFMIYNELLFNGHFKEYKEPWSRFIFDTKYKYGCVTNSSHQYALYILDILGLSKRFSLVTNNDVTKPKPDPEPYLKMSQILNVDPANMLVIEDSVVGLNAANKAGCITVFHKTHNIKSIHNLEEKINVITNRNPDGWFGY